MSSGSVRASEQQDFFISQMKQEIYEMRQRQRDYSQLVEQANFLEKKFRTTQDEKVFLRFNQLKQMLLERESDSKIS